MPTVFFIIRKRLEVRKTAIAPLNNQADVYFATLQKYWEYEEPGEQSHKFQKVVRTVKIMRRMSKVQKDGVRQMYQKS